MALTGAEKQRRHRQKLKENNYDAAKAAERARWHRRKQEGKIKTILNLTPREQRTKRKEWREMNRKRAAEKRSKQLQDISLDSNISQLSVQESTASNSRQRIKGRQKLRRDRCAAYRRIENLEQALSQSQRNVARYKKQLQRIKVLNLKKQKPPCIDILRQCDSEDDTPRKKSRKMANKPRQHIVKVMKFHYSLLQQLRERLNEKNTRKASVQMLAKVFGSASILRKYRTINFAKKAFGLSRKAIKTAGVHVEKKIHAYPTLITHVNSYL